MTTYINQPAGIGDCIWAMTLVEMFRADSDRIVWPVVPQYVEGLRRAYPRIEWRDHSKQPVPVDQPMPYQHGDMRVVPLRWCSQMMAQPDSECMRAKYVAYGFNWNIWKGQAMWERDKAKESALIERVALPQRFALVSDTYQTNMDAKARIYVPHLPAIRMDAIPGFSLFDWAGVMERATEIHAVSSASLYMLEQLDLDKPLHLYPRATDPNFDHVRFLFSKPYILH